MLNTLKTEQVAQATPANKNQYALLKAVMQEAGLLDPQVAYYAVKLTYTLALFAVGVGLMFLLDGWLRVLVCAPYLAFVSVQLAYMSHDLGHKQVFPSTRVNNWIGMLLGNLLVGMSMCWWVDKHNAHHANPNHDGMDPDIDIPFMAFSEEQAMRKKGLPRLLTGYQAYLFFPALTFTIYSMQITSIKYTLSERYRWQLPDLGIDVGAHDPVLRGLSARAWTMAGAGLYPDPQRVARLDAWGGFRAQPQGNAGYRRGRRAAGFLAQTGAYVAERVFDTVDRFHVWWA